MKVAGARCGFCKGRASQTVTRHGGKACPACGTLYGRGVGHPETEWSSRPWFLERLRTRDERGDVAWRFVPWGCMLVLERYSWEVP